MANVAFNADCMEVMARYPDGWFDLAVVDPPYGDAGGGASNPARGGGHFDRYKDWREVGGEVRKKILSWDVAPQRGLLQ